MASSFEIDAVSRSQTGTRASRRLRREESLIPGVIYGAQKDTHSISISEKKLNKALENEAFYSHILTINIDGEKEKAVLKNLHRHPYKPKILHVDFLRTSKTDKLHMNVPLHFLGEEVAPGVKQGGIVSKEIIDVEVICLPDDLPEFIEVDISAMEMNQTLHLSDLTFPKGIEIVALSHNNDAAVVSVHQQKIEVEPPPEEEAPTEEAESEEKPEEDNNNK